MSLCACGAESKRIRQFWDKGKLLREECPACAPQSFEKQADPSTKKIWIGPEYAPNDYEKRYDSEGVYYEPKPEVTAAREAALFKEAGEEERYAAAVRKKRHERRTEPLTRSEIDSCLRQADQILRPLIEDQSTAYDA